MPGRDNPNFRGIDIESARSAVPEGFWADLTNIDISTANRGRKRQALARISRNNLLSSDIVVSGELSDDFSSEPASGTSPSGSWGDFIHPVVSGINTNHTASGNFPQVTKVGEKVFGTPSGDYIVGHLFDNQYPLWALGFDYTEAAYGPFCDDSAHYSQCGWASGAKPSGLQIAPMVGLTVRTQPENESWYFGYILPTTVSSGEITQWGVRLIKVVSGVQKFLSQGGSLAATNTSGTIRLEAHDDSATSVTLKFFFNETELHSFTDNNASLYGDVLQSGYLGIGGINGLVGGSTQDHTSLTYLTDWEAGTLTITNDGGLLTSKPSGYAAVIEAQQAHGLLHYCYADASGNIILVEDPVREN